VFGEAAEAEAPPLADSVIRDAALHSSLNVGQRLGSQRVYCLDDVTLQLRNLDRALSRLESCLFTRKNAAQNPGQFSAPTVEVGLSR